jgi:hypothetical protein
MMRKGVYYIFVLIALYLIVVHFAGFSKDVSTSLSGGSGVIKSLQGR